MYQGLDFIVFSILTTSSLLPSHRYHFNQILPTFPVNSPPYQV